MAEIIRLVAVIVAEVAAVSGASELAATALSIQTSLWLP
jgi:hypothetical protein